MTDKKFYIGFVLDNKNGIRYSSVYSHKLVAQMDAIVNMLSVAEEENLRDKVTAYVYDTEEDKSYRKINDNTYIFEGKTLLNDFYKIVDCEEDVFDDVDDDPETIAGLLLSLKGDFPKEKESIEYAHFRFQVMKVTKRRIVNIKVTINPTCP